MVAAAAHGLLSGQVPPVERYDVYVVELFPEAKSAVVAVGWDYYEIPYTLTDSAFSVAAVTEWKPVDYGFTDEIAVQIKSLQTHTYGWAGVSGNAYLDKVQDIIPLSVMEQDIESANIALKAGQSQHYGYLDVMHEHGWTIGVCAHRSIVKGRRVEFNFGYIDPKFNDVAEKILKSGTELTMSREFEYWLSTGRKSVRIPTTVGQMMIAQKATRKFVKIRTYRFTVAKKGDEANALTSFKIYRLNDGTTA